MVPNEPFIKYASFLIWVLKDSDKFITCVHILIKSMKTRVLRKFKFSDLNLAFKVRGNMLGALKEYDANRNLLFDEY